MSSDTRTSHHASHFAHPHRNVGTLEIHPGMQVADFGAGSGAYVFAIAERLSGTGTVYAVDVQKDLLRRIKSEANHRHLHGVEVIWGDLEVPGGSKLADATLDLVLISNLLFQLEEKQVPLEEAKRVLKPDGRLVIIDWSESFGGLGPIEEHVVSKDEAEKLARAAGFELEEEFSAGAHHYGLSFSKGVRYARAGTHKLVVH